MLVYNKQLIKVFEKVCVWSVGMAALIIDLGSRGRWMMIFTLRPLYHREFRPDTLWVGHRGGSDPLEKTNTYGTITFLSLVFCLSAFILCLFPLVFHVSFPPIFPVFVSFFLPHSFILNFMLLSLLPHFLSKFISTPFPVLPWQSRLLILHIVTRALWNNSALALGLGRSFRLETHTKTIPEYDRYCSMTPTL